MEPRSDNDRILGFVEDGRDTHVVPYAAGLRVLHELPAAGHDHGRVASPALPNLRQLLSWPALLGRTTSSKDIELRVLRRAGHRAGPGLAPLRAVAGTGRAIQAGGGGDLAAEAIRS
jgi:hypothetical protein